MQMWGFGLGKKKKKKKKKKMKKKKKKKKNDKELVKSEPKSVTDRSISVPKSAIPQLKSIDCLNVSLGTYGSLGIPIENVAQLL